MKSSRIFFFMGLLIFGFSPGRLFAAGHGEASKTEKESESAHGEKSEGTKHGESEEGGEEGGKNKGLKGFVTGGRFAGDPVYVHLHPVILPIINDKGAQQLLTLLIDVQVKNMDVADEIHDQMPRITDAVLRALYGVLGEESSRNGPMVDIDSIKKRVAQSLDKLMGKSVVDDVLIQAIAQRML